MVRKMLEILVRTAMGNVITMYILYINVCIYITMKHLSGNVDSRTPG